MSEGWRYLAQNAADSGRRTLFFGWHPRPSANLYNGSLILLFSLKGMGADRRVGLSWFQGWPLGAWKTSTRNIRLLSLPSRRIPRVLFLQNSYTNSAGGSVETVSTYRTSKPGGQVRFWSALEPHQRGWVASRKSGARTSAHTRVRSFRLLTKFFSRRFGSVELHEG